MSCVEDGQKVVVLISVTVVTPLLVVEFEKSNWRTSLGPPAVATEAVRAPTRIPVSFILKRE